MLTLLLPALLGAVPLAAPATAPAPCKTMNTDHLPLATRKSPLDSLSFTVGKTEVRVCYGRPSARGRTMIGGADVPYGSLWRTGANEPTMIHTTGPLTVAGLKVEAGSYSLYTVPGEKEWVIVLNRSTSQWGKENGYTKEIEAQEVGRGKASTDVLKDPIETFTIRAEPASGGAKALVLEWEKTRVRIPLSDK